MLEIMGTVLAIYLAAALLVAKENRHVQFVPPADGGDPLSAVRNYVLRCVLYGLSLGIFGKIGSPLMHDAPRPLSRLGSRMCRFQDWTKDNAVGRNGGTRG